MMERILGPLPKHMIQKTRYVLFKNKCRPLRTKTMKSN